jgi:hypothetical protein
MLARNRLLIELWIIAVTLIVEARQFCVSGLRVQKHEATGPAGYVVPSLDDLKESKAV